MPSIRGASADSPQSLCARTRITYPDNSTLDLGGMSGADQAGYAGFKDKVNNRCG